MTRRVLRPRLLAAALLALFLAGGVTVPAGAARPGAAIPPLANPSLLQRLDSAQRAALVRNGFVVTAPAPVRDTRNLDQTMEWFNQDAQHAVHWQYYDLYSEN